ncbi:MAG TPA: bis-aminopropyl spermidine synthase family protein [Xanthobacteraceae bacterium]|nr:bis-aminopropyl spermidine synthase family protein [Xanthobacteraceae bacterium]
MSGPPDDASILETVARATRLREGPAGVAAVLRAVYRAGSLRLQDAAREARLPLPVTTAIRRELEKAGLLERRHGLSLTARGRSFVESALGLGVTRDMTCPACGGRGIIVPGDLAAAVERLATLIADAPPIDVTLDQCPCTPQTAILRALLMLETGALEGQRVLILGDDDSLSLAIGLVGRTLDKGDLTRGVTVIESDPRRVAFLRSAAESEEVTIDVIEHDLRAPLPDRIARAFDTAATDPPYTLAGARLFLARAGEALAGEGVCFFSFTQWPAPQLADLQRLFLDLGFAARAMHRGFNRYLGASVLGGVGDLLELAQVRAADAALPAWAGPLYTAEVNPRERIYVCAGCGAETTLGENGAPATIEALKAAGCPACGERIFRRRPGGTSPI